MVRAEGAACIQEAKRVVVEELALCGELRTPEEALESLESYTASRLSESDHAEIKQFFTRAALDEKAITPQVRSIAGRLNGRMAGLEHARKTINSLTRKVATRNLLPTESLARIKDAVRYTMVFLESFYTENVNQALDHLRVAGFKEINLNGFRNAWGGVGYQGINTGWYDPQKGRRFEIQFHTEVSLEAREVTHPIYNYKRLLGISQATKDSLTKLQNRVFSKVRAPPGAETVIGW
jgi:hypothetical protein